MIAGFETASSGKVFLDGKDITGTAPQFRSIGMVFQNYALFPHMTVSQNVAFGLGSRGLSKSEIRRKVEGILETVHLSEKIDVPVPNLSGGEQQRVAVARALVVEPRVLLFDEPLSNLDVTLRLKTREEIRSLQRATGITTLYVTHDQSEAMSLSDRIAVMKDARIQQVGGPADIYEHPSDAFIAQFVGGANILHGTMYSPDRQVSVEGQVLAVPPMLARQHSGEITLAIKPEAIGIMQNSAAGDLQAVVHSKEYLGYTTHFVLEVKGMKLSVTAPTSEETKRVAVGETVAVRIDWSRTTIFPG